jgi:hypothetical protein
MQIIDQGIGNAKPQQAIPVGAVYRSSRIHGKNRQDSDRAVRFSEALPDETVITEGGRNNSDPCESDKHYPTAEK